ncbi:hypothetical protein BDZ89DRAFT_1071828 [Hymenopellis radicata]|nr:hypothetical protein BDZ89DRAFT_1071828 [Hymenopellis radicata]
MRCQRAFLRQYYLYQADSNPAPLTESFPQRESLNLPSNTTADVGKIPDTVIVIHLGDRLPLVVARSALLQPSVSVSSVMSYIAPHVQNPWFTTRDIPGFKGKPVSVVPRYWDELLPYIRELTINPLLRHEGGPQLWSMILNYLFFAALNYFIIQPLGLKLKKFL